MQCKVLQFRIAIYFFVTVKFYENSFFPKVIMAGMVSIFMLLSISKRVKGQKRGMEATHPAAAVGHSYISLGSSSERSILS